MKEPCAEGLVVLPHQQGLTGPQVVPGRIVSGIIGRTDLSEVAQADVGRIVMFQLDVVLAVKVDDKNMHCAWAAVQPMKSQQQMT